MNMLDFNLNPQAALDTPRWQWVEGKRVKIEQHFPRHIAEALERKGHNIEIELDSSSFGRGQIIFRDNRGVLMGGTEPRADGGVAAW
jgi:gamma-glutamyltranspeptidase/glutathione hydrolase